MGHEDPEKLLHTHPVYLFLEPPSLSNKSSFIFTTLYLTIGQNVPNKFLDCRRQVL